MKNLTLLASLLLGIYSSAQEKPADEKKDTLKHFTAVRVSAPPKIDGLLTDSVWQHSNVMSDFVQRLPIEKAAPTQRTEVRIIYDDKAIYIGAMLYDNHPDSILRELGGRDSWELNADEFEVFFDTYHSNQDAFAFRVSASGVQGETKVSDYTYNAVWVSSVKIVENGW